MTFENLRKDKTMNVMNVVASILLGGIILPTASLAKDSPVAQPSKSQTTPEQKFPGFNYKTHVNSSEAYSLRAQNFIGQRNWKQAASEYTKALSFPPAKSEDEKAKLERSSMYFMLAKCYADLHDTKKQLANLDALIKYNPASTSYAARGQYYYDQTNYQKALADYNKAIEIAPSKWDRPYDGRGRVYVRMKQFKNAIADLDQYCVINPKVPHAYLERSNAYKQMNDLVAAKKDSDIAKKLEQDAQHLPPFGSGTK